MAIKIEVSKKPVQELSGISQKTGKPYSMKIQTMYLHMQGEPYPIAFEHTLERDQEPFPAGAILSFSPEECISVFNNRITLRPQFKPVSSNQKAAA